MRNLFLVLAIVSIVILSGCGPKRLTSQEAESAFGSFPENYRALIQEAVPPYLIDPASAMFYFSDKPPVAVDTGDFRSGWKVTFWVNAKNRMGGYTGKRPWICTIKNGEVISCSGGNQR